MTGAMSDVKILDMTTIPVLLFLFPREPTSQGAFSHWRHWREVKYLPTNLCLEFEAVHHLQQKAR